MLTNVISSARCRLLTLMLTLFFTLLPAGVAQEEAPDSAGATADQAVLDWLATEIPPFQTMAALPTEQLCEYIPMIMVNPPPAQGTRVNLDDRMEQPAAAESERVFSYSSSGPAGQLAVVQVTVRETGDGWQAVNVGFRQPAPSGIRAWVQTPAASWTFIVFSALVLALLIRPSGLRRLLGRGLAVIRAHRGAYTVTLVLMFGLFGAGMLTGSTMPDECTAAIMDTVEAAVTSVGATAAYSSGDIPRAATVTFHQNFIVVSASTLFSLALLFGVPAYLFGGFSFYLQAVPFGMVAPGGLEALLMVILLALELFAYFTVIAGGGFLLVTLIRKGFQALPEAVGKLLLMLPLAGLLLLVGAWYEAWILIGLA